MRGVRQVAGDLRDAGRPASCAARNTMAAARTTSAGRGASPRGGRPGQREGGLAQGAAGKAAVAGGARHHLRQVLGGDGAAGGGRGGPRQARGAGGAPRGAVACSPLEEEEEEGSWNSWRARRFLGMGGDRLAAETTRTFYGLSSGRRDDERRRRPKNMGRIREPSFPFFEPNYILL